MAIKVVQVVYSFWQGGSELLAQAIARGIDRTRFASVVCALDLGGPLEADFERDAIPHYVMYRRPKFDWRVIWRLYRLFRRERADIVQTHHLGQLIYGACAARGAGAKLVHVEHDFYSIQSAKSRSWLRLLTPLCDKVIAVSDPVADFLHTEVGVPRSKLATIYNGVDLSRFGRPAPGSRAQLGLAEEDRVIGSVCRLEDVKDPVTLLEAFRLVRASFPRAKLVLVGDGSLRATVERRRAELDLEKDVILTGARIDVPELLSLFDVFVLASFQEGLPLAILEAMAAGKPVVATEVGSIPRMVRHGETGFLVPPRSPGRLAEAIERVLSDELLASRMGRAGRAVVESTYDLATTLRSYQHVYESVLKSAGPVRPWRSAARGPSSEG